MIFEKVSVFILLVVILAFVHGDDCDVTFYGAKGDNKTESTQAFVTAIKTCQGPTKGAVVVPAGKYLIRPVKLLSHTQLVILPGATLVAWFGVGWENGWPNSTTMNCSASSYTAKDPVMVPRLESLLYGDALTNVTIRGGGTIDGQVGYIDNSCARTNLIRVSLHSRVGAGGLCARRVSIGIVVARTSSGYTARPGTHMTLLQR